MRTLILQAYKNWLQNSGTPSEEAMPGLEHLTHDQLFFLNFAQVWCGSTRPEALRSKLKTAVHAPGKFRYLVKNSCRLNCVNIMNPKYSVLHQTVQVVLQIDL